jgi:hypothetical protein
VQPPAPAPPLPRNPDAGDELKSHAYRYTSTAAALTPHADPSGGDSAFWTLFGAMSYPDPRLGSHDERTTT